MEQTLAHSPKNINLQGVAQVQWQRVLLLGILAYEGLGAIGGGILLILAPDGHFMQMPVEIMHGVFDDFLVPGMILFALGLFTMAAFFSVLRRTHSDWLMAGIALGALLTWFVVEIAILRELHWLHGMWGIPVLLGWVVLFPLIALRHEAGPMRKLFLTCGILSSLWYLVINIIIPKHDCKVKVLRRVMCYCNRLLGRERRRMKIWMLHPAGCQAAIRVTPGVMILGRRLFLILIYRVPS